MSTLERLEQTIAARRAASPDSSYVAKLNAKGLHKISQKVGEEATEAVIAAVAGSDEELVSESADLVFHLLVLLQAKGLSFNAVLDELDLREGLSGIDEKASRKND